MLDDFEDLKESYKTGSINKEFAQRLPLLGAALEARASTGSLNTCDYLDLLKYRCLYAESLYWLGRMTEMQTFLTAHDGLSVSEEIMAQSQRSVKELQTAVEELAKAQAGAEPSEAIRLARDVWREKCRLTISVALAHHRNDECSEALRLLKAANVVAHLLVDSAGVKNYPCHGTKGQIFYHTGIILRKLGDFKEAEEMFDKSSEAYLRRLEYHENQQRENLNRTQSFSKTRVGLNLTNGKAFLQMRNGWLRQALASIRYGKLLISRDDIINHSFSQLQEAVLMRDLDCDSEETLLAVKEKIDQAEHSFADMKHLRYVELATYERVLSLYYQMRLYKGKSRHAEIAREAFGQIAEIKRHAKNDVVWLAKYLLLEAAFYVELEEYAKAEEILDEAIDSFLTRFKSDESNSKPGLDYLIRLYVVRSRTRTERQKYEQAKDDLRQARQLNIVNHLNIPEAVIKLESARLNIRQNQLGEAKEYLNSARSLVASLEMRTLHISTKEIESELQAKLKTEFSISPDDLNFQRNVENFKHHLIEFALTENSNSIDNAAKALGMDRASLYRVRRRLKVPVARRKKD